MNEVISGCVGLAAVLVLFLTGIELAFSMLLVGFLGFAYLVSFEAAMHLVAKDLFEVFASYGYTVFPIFILMGQIAFNSGIAKRLYDSAYTFLGHIPGGLAMATVGGATAFKALCGSAAATAATFASVAIPEMDRYHYSKKISTGIVATVGTLGCMIPPSVFLIIFGIITEQSIGKLFLAGIVPGLFVAVTFLATIYVWGRKNPTLAPAGERSTWKARFLSLPEVVVVLAIFVLMIVGLMKGFFTPTEAGSVGTAAVVLLVVLRRQLKFKGYVKAVSDSMRTACMMLMLIGGSAVLGHFIAITNIPQIMADWVVALPLNRNIIMVLICLIYILGGSFIDDLAFMILATPIFFPAVLKLGFDPIWFCIMIGVTQMIGVVIPPVAINVFIVTNITKVPMGVVYSGVYPFLAGIVFFGALLFLFPQLALFLPHYFMP
ncbi:MAG TPA: TRAP transporter large permease [Syntrophorhabdales bacterium]|nr:TRAP transporter large permease [Syntrophorhabdales bacterium]